MTLQGSFLESYTAYTYLCMSNVVKGKCTLNCNETESKMFKEVNFMKSSTILMKCEFRCGKAKMPNWGVVFSQ